MKTPDLTISNLSLSLGTHANKQEILKDITLTVPGGSTCLIMGPSGSGKTTLISIAAGLLNPSLGTVHFGDTLLASPSHTIKDTWRRNNVGFIFQDSLLISPLTVSENILIASTGKAAYTRHLTLCEELGISHLLTHKPTQLSGGERQRVAIARALIMNPALIFADEPTASLDSENGHEAVELITKIARHNHSTVVIVSHDARLEHIASQKILLTDGRI